MLYGLKSSAPTGMAYRSSPVSCTPTTTYSVDTCGTGIGAEDGSRAYAAQVAPIHDPVDNIAELEAINVLMALHTFLSEADRGGHIHLLCDNMAVVLVLQSGKGKNSAIIDSARGAWMVQALFDLQITYAHIAGEDNGKADRLSRAHISEADYKKAKEVVDSNQLKIIRPCTVAL